MADKKIVSRIFFFTPAGQVLDNSQQEKIIDYAVDRKTLRTPPHKTTFWQRISNIQDTINVSNTPGSEELETSKHAKALKHK